MAWIDIVDEEDAEGELAEIYEEISDRRGKVANIMRVHSLDPEAMRDHMDLYTTLMFSRGALGREECELVATVVSSSNDCDYCVNHHAVALAAYWSDEQRLEALVRDWRSLEWTDRHRAMLSYAERLTESPADVSETDVDELRDAGLEDAEILHLNLVVSYFNFVNRIAEGLGVEFSENEMSGYEY